MPWQLVEKVAADFAENQIAVNWLHEMGEPLLYPRLVEAIDLFPGCSLSSNAVALSEEKGRQLLDSSLQRIRLCVDTINPEVYTQIRRGGIFNKVVANIRSFLEQSKGHDIRVEIQRMIALPSANESVADFERYFELDRFPQAKVVEKTCEGLDTSAATDLHEAYHGCFQGYPFKWFIVLADGRVTHCCYDADCQQPIGDMRTQTVREILASDTIAKYMAAFKAKDWQTLPRCGECFQNATGRAAVTAKLVQLGHQLDRVLPVKAVARKLINR
jgi:MoaA/NifB/PqqE/SkfB family radical SAM enzyme